MRRSGIRSATAHTGFQTEIEFDFSKGYVDEAGTLMDEGPK